MDARPPRERRRGPRAALLRLVLQARRPQPVALHRRLHRLRRRDVRPRRRRQPPRAVHLLGADHGLLLHPHRAQPRPLRQPPLGHAGPARDDLRRARDARRHGHPRRDLELHDQRDAREPPAGRRAHDHRGHARPPRRPDEVRADPLPLLAPRRHGRTDPGQRLPARRVHGQGRHLPHPAARPGLRHRPGLAPRGHRPRHRHDDHRRLARPPPGRHQAAPRLRHREPARHDDRALRRRQQVRRLGHARPRDVARALQVHALLRRRHHRQGHRDA